MKIDVTKQFGVPVGSFALSPSATAYTLQYSADGEHFTDYPTQVPANETLVVNSFANGLIYKLNGASGDMYLKY